MKIDVVEPESQQARSRPDTGATELEPRTWRTTSTVSDPLTETVILSAPATATHSLAAQAAESQGSAVGLSLVKRAFDILVSLTALLFVGPLLMLAAAALWVESGRPIFFRQHRTGYKGQTFVILKLRTMRVLEDGEGLTQATRGDARITRVGAFLRKSSIDELPQLINVLKGDMSLVGPRPHALAHDQLYGAALPNYQLRFGARPGLTGLAQIRGLRGEIHVLQDMAHRVEADIEYIKDWSLMRDVRIMLRTVPLLFHDARAY
ncbi:sugar transferase [Phenylobacterium deserti]|uniref:Exopolysaccharide biosynthesis protein n=1 Tax=Phenylobacterium deserti TaxID=1914756 RepID=A0A328AX76_9CAUL|nr:sugar transferase [Phenylobacterium deserti]RAK58306.1 exopolysaccharide biosynthesis protein [Phenylobacterium deserti]